MIQIKIFDIFLINAEIVDSKYYKIIINNKITHLTNFN